MNTLQNPRNYNDEAEVDKSLSVNNISKDDSYFEKIKNESNSKSPRLVEKNTITPIDNDEKNISDLKNQASLYSRPIDTVANQGNVGKIYRLNSDVKVEPNNIKPENYDIKVAIDYDANTKKDYYALISDAYEALETGKYDISREYYKKALEMDKNSYDALLGIGNSYHFLGQKKDAMKYYLMALKIKPDSKNVMNNIFSIISSLDSEIGLAELKKIYKIKRDDAIVIGQIALIYAQKNDNRRALKYFKKANFLDNSNPLNIYNTAIVYENMGDFDMAKSYYLYLLSFSKDSLEKNDISEKGVRSRLSQIRKSELNAKI